MMHDLCGQMLELLEGAQQAAADPALRTLLQDRSTKLRADQKALEVVMLQQPQAAPGPRGADPTRTMQ